MAELLLFIMGKCEPTQSRFDAAHRDEVNHFFSLCFQQNFSVRRREKIVVLSIRFAPNRVRIFCNFFLFFARTANQLILRGRALPEPGQYRMNLFATVT